MISPFFSNRLTFVFSLLGLGVVSFLFYEYTFSDSVVCLIGSGCDTVRLSPYSSFLGISIPILGVAFYLTMAGFSVVRSHAFFSKKLFRLQLLGSLAGAGFGIYLTFLEVFVIKAICFWCALSFIISLAVLLSVILSRKNNL